MRRTTYLLGTLPTATAKDTRHADEAKGRRKRHPDDINSWHHGEITPRRRGQQKAKRWNLPRCEVPAGDHRRVPLSGEKAEDESKRKLLSLCKMGYACFRIPLRLFTDIFEQLTKGRKPRQWEGSKISTYAGQSPVLLVSFPTPHPSLRVNGEGNTPWPLKIQDVLYNHLCQPV